MSDDLPSPLVPADCDLTDFQFMPLDVARLRDSELSSSESPEACWAAVLLWCASWHQIPAASVPADDKWLAKASGYGRVVKEWARVKAGAMRGFIECTDGRLYHPVVAEKAREAWQAKLAQRWRAECGRVKKHNQRHGTTLTAPEFADWMASGRPVGQPLFVPGDKASATEDKDGDKASKGEGEGQRQGDSIKTSEPNGSAGADAPPVDNSNPENPKNSPPATASTAPPTPPVSPAKQAWRDCGKWMVANGVAESTAREVMGLVLKDYPAVALDAMQAAPKQAEAVDPKGWLMAAAKRLAGERINPVTAPSDDAAKTAAEWAAREAAWTPEAKAASEAARQAAMAAFRAKTAGAIACPS